MKRRREAMGPVVVLAVLAFGAYAFLAIADEVAEGEIRALDRQLFVALRDPANPSEPLGPPWLEEVALEITALGGYTLIVLALAVIVGLLVVTRRYGPALYAVLSVGSGALISHFLKQYYERPRPDLADHLDVVHTLSFPSGHALVATVAYLTMAALVVRFFDDLRVRLYVLFVAVAVSVAVGITRVYLGVHWPSDVAAGWALGAAWASLTWLVVSLLQYRRRGNSAKRGGDHGA
ncbi:phosphatase PAP2 family protein [Chelativorans sp. EGI FJ00035]|uniref:Phosphatase PAP2 family protein n=2 Tax=Chelativorans salis TaxID=2978478 RepID=A0ABT2LNJ4_9HYPH|nr:phosphatase PAP2 family protein [Chelativorans sp. EGI FJ00035]